MKNMCFFQSQSTSEKNNTRWCLLWRVTTETTSINEKGGIQPVHEQPLTTSYFFSTHAERVEMRKYQSRVNTGTKINTYTSPWQLHLYFGFFLKEQNRQSHAASAGPQWGCHCSSICSPLKRSDFDPNYCWWWFPCQVIHHWFTLCCIY